MKTFLEFLGFMLVFTIALTVGVKAMVKDDKTPEIVKATISEALPINTVVPTFSTSSPALVLAGGAILSYIDEANQTHTLYTKEPDTPFLIASITKLLTASVAQDIVPKISIAVSKSVLDKRGAIKKLPIGAYYSTDTLYRTLLIESNNDAAWMLSENYGVDNFVAKMNEKAKIAGMSHSSFGNPVGLDAGSDMKGNSASPQDLSNFAKYLNENYPGIFEITRFKNTVITDTAGKNTYVATTTNQLLLEDNLPITIIGGKTGETPLAAKNLLLVFKKEGYPGYFISVVLNSKDNFADTKAIVNGIN